MGKRIRQTVILILASSFLGACASHYEMTAPCDPMQCKDRIKVNTWPSK